MPPPFLFRLAEAATFAAAHLAHGIFGALVLEDQFPEVRRNLQRMQELFRPVASSMEGQAVDGQQELGIFNIRLRELQQALVQGPSVAQVTGSPRAGTPQSPGRSPRTPRGEQLQAAAAGGGEGEEQDSQSELQRLQAALRDSEAKRRRMMLELRQLQNSLAGTQLQQQALQQQALQPQSPGVGEMLELLSVHGQDRHVRAIASDTLRSFGCYQ